MAIRTLKWKLGRLAILTGAMVLVSYNQPSTMPSAAACYICVSSADCESGHPEGGSQCTINGGGCTVSGKCSST